MDSEGVESIEEMEDDIEDIEEDEMEEMSPEEVGIQPRFPKPVYPKRYVQPSSYTEGPDVLGYLNTFRQIDDNERIRLARACVNYLTAKERQRNGYFLKRQEMLQQRQSGPKSLKRSRSMRAIDLTAVVKDKEELD